MSKTIVACPWCGRDVGLRRTNALYEPTMSRHREFTATFRRDDEWCPGSGKSVSYMRASIEKVSRLEGDR